jgi:hypothetical protein
VDTRRADRNGLTASCDVWLPTTTVASIGAAGTTASWIHIAAGGGDAGQVLGAIQGDLSVLQQNSRSPNAAAGAIPKSTSFNVSIQLVHTTSFNWTVTVKVNGRPSTPTRRTSASTTSRR